MRTMLLTIAGVILLAGGGITYATQVNEKTTPVEETNTSEHERQNKDNVKDQNEYQEFKTIDEIVDTTELNKEIVEDNKNKRITLLTDEHNQVQFKSIYVKSKNRLKIIEVDGGVIFNQVLDKKDVNQEDKTEDIYQDGIERDEEEISEVHSLEEYTTLANHVDIANFDTQIVEDNPYKRVMVLNEKDGNTTFKSIYLKHKNFIKVIDLHDGLVYKGTVQ